MGEKTPSTAVTNEYAKADPIYVEKTLVCSVLSCSPSCCELSANGII